MRERVYAAIDLKSFYASVECMQRGLDPMTTNLVVADAARSEKTICLAVSPSLKAYGIPGRARLFEVVQRVGEVNARRRSSLGGRAFTGASCCDAELKAHPELELSYIAAPPRMSKYMEESRRIYQIYTRFAAPEDIHVYSVDEVFIDLTGYVKPGVLSARELTMRMIRSVLDETGITATAGIGTNLYLAKIAMDIEAKHCMPDENGVRIAELDEPGYRRKLWTHRPLTDFWRVGRGYAAKLEANGLYTMGDVARCSLDNEALIYKLFGVNGELLIDHAWGWEPCTVADIKAYKPRTNSISSGQVLPCPYDFDKARLIVREMAEQQALELLDKGLVTDRLELTLGYDIENLSRPEISRQYKGEVTTDYYGRKIPKNAHGTARLKRQCSSARLITQAVTELFEDIADRKLLVRRVWLTAAELVPEAAAPAAVPEQLDLFTDYEALEQARAEEAAALARERRAQETVLKIKKKYGKNAILKGTNFEEGATAIERNSRIGGHKA